MSIFEQYRHPPKEWAAATTGEVVKPVGQIVLTDTLIAIESLYSQDLDAEHYGLTEADLGPKAEGKGGAKRGEITEFSRASQQRLMKRLASWQLVGRVLIVTLTYPRQFPSTDESKKDLERFRRLLRAQFPELAGMWKLEYQTRGAPHYHLVLDTAGTAIQLKPSFKGARDGFRSWLDIAWRKARRSNLPARTQAQWAKDDARARFYLAKETGKTAQASMYWRRKMDQEIEHTGRFWGWHGKDKLTFRARTITLPAKETYEFRRRLQETVARDMIRGGRLTRDEDGTLRDRRGDEVDPAGLPSWHLFEDSALCMRRILREMEAEGYRIPPPDGWDMSENPFR